ncbi:transglycosylase domain-containing protein [Candidatus Dojkabacteria bacterium]|nr:transglycosylase domain-containing protein [Candidatus Dojkabacteria bacterium]
MRNHNFTNIIKKRRKIRQLMKSEVVVVILAMFIIFFSVLFLFSLYQLKLFTQKVPTEAEIISKVSEKSENSKVYDRNGILLYEFQDPSKDREYAYLDEIPLNLIWILLSAEDINFYNHEGIDLKGILRSIEIYYSSKGITVVGGSTITQQLVKNTVLTNEKTFERKAREIFISFLIETKYSKSEILEMYFNSISFGGNIIGIKTAARTYFSKELKDLTFNESVFLISLIQLPGRSSPLFSNNEQVAWDIVETRKDYIYEQIKNNYRFIKSKYDEFPNIDSLNLSEVEPIILKPNIGEIKAPHFVFYIKNVLKNEPYNLTEEQLGNNGYKIYTTLDYNLQKIAETKLKEGVERYKNFGFANAALVSMNPQTGEILSMVGSKDYFGVKNSDGSFDPYVNVAISERNLGSSLKPFIAYEAFKLGKFNPNSIIIDAPININGYSPKNYDGTYMGAMTVKKALVISRNIPFVKITNSVGVPNVVDILERLGYTNAKYKDRYGLAIALGGFSANLLEHTHAYSVFPNDGEYPPIVQITNIKQQNGDEIYKLKITKKPLLEKEYTQQVSEILAEYGLEGISGKTGTTDSNRDNYFIGYNKNFLAGIWIGNNNNKRMSDNAFGSTTALPIWNMYYLEVIKQFPEYK